MHSISAPLYATPPSGILFHYTSLQGMTGIIDSGAIWASDVRYLNDAAEVRHTTDLIVARCTQRIEQGIGDLLLWHQFQEWMQRGISRNHLLFGTSFRANGNLLSQWRGYSTPGKGVSLGFDAAVLQAAAQRQGFRIGRCIYNAKHQQQLIDQLLDQLAHQARHDASIDQQDPNYLPLFEQLEADLLQFAALLKHPTFAEEEEWRLVASVMADDTTPGLAFREGRSMLVPYVEFKLRADPQQSFPLSQLYLGPTPNATLSMQSLALYLKQQNIQPPQGLHYCNIPYRGRN